MGRKIVLLGTARTGMVEDHARVYVANEICALRDDR
jgi:hypothetical protein